MSNSLKKNSKLVSKKLSNESVNSLVDHIFENYQREKLQIPFDIERCVRLIEIFFIFYRYFIGLLENESYLLKHEELSYNKLSMTVHHKTTLVCDDEKYGDVHGHLRSLTALNCCTCKDPTCENFNKSSSVLLVFHNERLLFHYWVDSDEFYITENFNLSNGVDESKKFYCEGSNVLN